MIYTFINDKRNHYVLTRRTSNGRMLLSSHDTLFVSNRMIL